MVQDSILYSLYLASIFLLNEIQFPDQKKEKNSLGLIHLYRYIIVVHEDYHSLLGRNEASLGNLRTEPQTDQTTSLLTIQDVIEDRKLEQLQLKNIM